MRRADWLLAWWLLLSLVWDVLVVGTTTYLVFWRGHSGWWFVLASLFTYSSALYKALKKRYGVSDDN